jgi:hypothetical protein
MRLNPELSTERFRGQHFQLIRVACYAAAPLANY